MPKLYRPSNGTEGACFFEEWCSHCARDKAMSEGKPLDECDDNEVCRIIEDVVWLCHDHHREIHREFP